MTASFIFLAINDGRRSLLSQANAVLTLSRRAACLRGDDNDDIEMEEDGEVGGGGGRGGKGRGGRWGVGA